MEDENKKKKILMTVKEISDETGIGESKIRQMLNSPNSSFTIRCGRNIYAHRELFEKYLERCAKYRTRID